MMPHGVLRICQILEKIHFEFLSNKLIYFIFLKKRNSFEVNYDIKNTPPEDIMQQVSCSSLNQKF